MPLHIFNTLTRKKEPFTPIDPKKVKLYTCGPTVYNFAHIGNLRTFVFEDFFRRTLEYFNFTVKHVMNITDIDDKTIKGANAKKIGLREFTDVYTKAFLSDLKKLNVLPAHHNPRASDYVKEMIAMIQSLLNKKIAYTDSLGNVFFNIKKYEDYGKLSGLKLDELQEGASNRVDSDEYEKIGASDFVLWKAYDEKRDGPIYFEAPWAKGRPGWHIECSAMAKALLGESIDVHMGGVDNIFPHHENEIAQSECCNHKELSRYWVHAEHLLVDGKKMSKSLGNFYTLRDLLDKGYTTRQIRFVLLQAHYRTQANFTFESLVAADHALKRIDACIEQLEQIEGDKEAISFNLCPYLESLDKSLMDDLNTPLVYAALFNMVAYLNTLLEKKVLSIRQAKEAFCAFDKFELVLGFIKTAKEKIQVPQEILEALEKRNQARKKKDYETADKMRALIDKAGYQIVDTDKKSYVKPL